MARKTIWKYIYVRGLEYNIKWLRNAIRGVYNSF